MVLNFNKALNCALIGRKSKDDSDSSVCGWHKHINPIIIWDSSTCNYWRVQYLCANHHFNHCGWSLQRHCGSSEGWLITNLLVFDCLAIVCYTDIFSIRLVINMQKFEAIMRGTQGALIVASTLQIIFGFSGLWRNVVRFVLV